MNSEPQKTIAADEICEDYDFSKVGPIVIIDDDQSFRTIIQEVLNKHGINPILCESAAHALKFIERQSWNWHPWMIITDLVMNGMGGFELLRRLSVQYPQKSIPLVVVSRLTGAEDVSEAELAGAAAYLSKPLKKDKLVSLIARVNGHPREKGPIPFTQDLGPVPHRPR